MLQDMEKYNEIQLAKNKMDLNNRKITNHRAATWPHRQGGCLACCSCTLDSR